MPSTTLSRVLEPAARSLNARHVDARQGHRRSVERFVELAQHFEDADRLLVEQVYLHGMSMAEVARATGDHPRNVQRRMQTLMQRAQDPTFEYLTRRRHTLPRDLQVTARLRILQGQSLRRITRLTGRKLHDVRTQVEQIHGIVRTALQTEDD